MSCAGELSYDAGTVIPMDQRGTGQVVLELQCSGQVDRLDEVQRRVDALLEHGPRTLVVDLSEGVLPSSSTISALMWVRRRASARGVEMVLGDADRRVVETLLRSGVIGALALKPPAGSSAPSGPTSSRRRRAG